MATVPVHSPHLHPLSGRHQPAVPRAVTHYTELVWVALAAIVGFLVSTIFAAWLELERSWFVLGYAALTLPLIVAYVRWGRIDVMAMLRRRLPWAGGAGALLGAGVVFSVLSQEGSSRASGGAFAFHLLWWGVVYGTVDALLLNVLPVLATWRAFTPREGPASRQRRIGAGALALLASVLVTAAYHAGFPEYQSAELAKPIVGDVISLAYLLTGNPISSVIAHVAMHVAGVIHGATNVSQLPPHS